MVYYLVIKCMIMFDIRPGCNCCDHKVDRKRHELIKRRNYIVKTEMKNKNRDRIIENIYKEV